jgi:hypothetical protein
MKAEPNDYSVKQELDMPNKILSARHCVISYLRLVIILPGIMLAACSYIHTTTPTGVPQDMTQQEFADYVERVFRHHNTVYNSLITELALENPDYNDTENAELHKAEKDMLTVCAPLNEVVSARAEGRQLDMASYMKLTSSVPACEAATERVEDLIP